MWLRWVARAPSPSRPPPASSTWRRPCTGTSSARSRRPHFMAAGVLLGHGRPHPQPGAGDAHLGGRRARRAAGLERERPLRGRRGRRRARRRRPRPPSCGSPPCVAAVIMAIRAIDALAVRRGLLAERDRLLVIDPLTGAYNRRFLAQESDRAFARARRGEEAVSAIALDLDGFKGVNDRFGHGARRRAAEGRRRPGSPPSCASATSCAGSAATSSSSSARPPTPPGPSRSPSASAAPSSGPPPSWSRERR